MGGNQEIGHASPLPVTISSTCQMLRPSTSSHPTPSPAETVLLTDGTDFRTFEGRSHDAGGGR
jgi:hypothetical protein